MIQGERLTLACYKLPLFSPLKLKVQCHAILAIYDDHFCVLFCDIIGSKALFHLPPLHHGSLELCSINVQDV